MTSFTPKSAMTWFTVSYLVLVSLAAEGARRATEAAQRNQSAKVIAVDSCVRQ